MAGKQQPEQGEGSRQGSSFLDHFLRRLDSKESAEVLGVATTSQSQASPSSSVAALVSHYDDLSPNPTNPWQYLSLSNPASPTSHHNNQLSAHSSLYSSGGHFLEAEWMPEELEQQRVASQAHNRSATGVASRAPAMKVHDHHLQPPSNPDGANSSAGNGVEQTSEANFLYDEAAAAWFDRSASGYVRGDPDLSAASQRQGLYENFARLGSSDGEARMRSWERAMPGQHHGTIFPNRAPPSSDITGTPSDSIRSANSVGTPSNTSLSSGSGGEDSDDVECARVDPPPGTSVTGDGNSSGKRKTPEPSGEEAGNDSARTSSEPAASLPPRKKLSFKKAREPRYAIKTRTDVDIMDDGFKWRKYGQKAVKNSPHPRNYYRCTTPQCPVRKRVERSREDPGLVITTYEGTHTHQTPGFRTPAPGEGYWPGSGLGVGLFGPRFPCPPEFSLAALYQLRTLQQTARSLQVLAQHQIPGIPLGARFPPGSDLQRESLRRAQQFLGLHDPSFGSVKQEPLHFRGANHGLPFPGIHFQPPPGCLDRTPIMRQPQQMRPRGGRPHPPPRNLTPMSDLHYPEFSPRPPTDTDLVRRVLEAEEQALPCGNGNAEDIPIVDSSSPFNHGEKFASGLRSRVELERLRSLQRSSQPVLLRRREAGSTDNLVAAGSSSSQADNSLVDGLLQEMTKPGNMELNPNVSRLI